MFNFGYALQYNCNPFMNFFMPFNMPVMNFYNPFSFMVPQQQSIFPMFGQMNYYNSYNTASAPSIFTGRTSRTSRTYSSPGVTKTKPVEKTSKQDKPYNEVNGKKLAEKVVANLPNDRDPENPLCARYVQNAVVDCGLGEYVKGNGAYCKYIFRANPNFKEIKSKDFSTLPAGAVIVYQAGEKVTFKDGSTGEIGENGHVTIALGDGRACSDIIENEIAYSSKACTFIPV